MVYFNRSDVQAAINAPVGTNWAQCNDGVFRKGNRSVNDGSLGPAQDGVLAKVIEYTNNTIIGSGNLDMLLSTNGTLLAIQNMTVSPLPRCLSFRAQPSLPRLSRWHPRTCEATFLNDFKT